MRKIKLLIVGLALSTSTVCAQHNFTFTPEKPQPGQAIKISYTPAGDLANTLDKVEAVVYLSGSGGRKADDLVLTKSGKYYTATIQTDTSNRFIQLGFYVDKKYDNNFNEGYFIQLYDGDKIRKRGHIALAFYHQYYCEDTHVETSTEKTLAAFEKEFALYPEQRREYLDTYFRLLYTVKPTEAPVLIQSEIEAIVKAGLKTETDYQLLENLYAVAKLPEQAKLVSGFKREKFPEGKWLIQDMVDKFYAENDAARKAELLAVMEKNIQTNKDWKDYENGLPYFRSTVISLYAKAKDWTTYKKLTSELTDKNAVASSYNKAAWSLQEKNEELKMAEEFARFATEQAKKEIKTPTVKRPPYYTAKQWDKQREQNYAMFTDTYAMVLYRMGEYKKGFDLIKETALGIYKGSDVDQNKTYTLLAEKVLPAKELKRQLEKFVKEGNFSSEVKDALKRIYMQEKNTEVGFDEYIAILTKETYLKMLEDVRKSMISEESPSFVLNDINGKPVSNTDLRGKVVIIDFWATWCGPCKSSFPGMQKMVNKYKDHPDVKFVFVDTWERAESKEKNASEFITANKYTFDVLMDNDNKVVEQFKVEGIPTKFVLDKDGRIRFKSVGFDGGDEKLISELSVMIEMARGEKTF